MTGDELARSYVQKASARRRVLDVLMEEEAYSDVVREAQELVELALKAALRLVGIDPPKWHDVGPILREHSEKYPNWFRDRIGDLAEVSAWLRREREFAFYGDVDVVPTQTYAREDADRARQDAQRALEAVEGLLSERS